MELKEPSTYLQFRKWVSGRLYKEIGFGRTQRIGCNKIVKTHCSIAEVETMEYIRKNTSIPIPRVVRLYKCTSGIDIVMGLVKGKTLDVAWQELSSVQREAIVKELSGYIEQLRQLVPHVPGVGSVRMSSGLDHRLGGNRWGPFPSVSDFHTYLRRGIPLDGIWRDVPKVVEVHRRSPIYSTRFTHADLSPENVMVKDGKITGIIDWEFSGWYPEYWEYTKIYYGWRPYREDFYYLLDRFVKTYPEELAAEREIWKRLSTFAYDLPVNMASTDVN